MMAGGIAQVRATGLTGNVAPRLRWILGQGGVHEGLEGRHVVGREVRLSKAALSRAKVDDSNIKMATSSKAARFYRF